MTFTQDLLSLILGCLAYAAVYYKLVLAASLAGGLCLAGGCWWACSTFSVLWNRAYRITLLHHVLCLCAALLTFVFTLLFTAAGYLRNTAEWSVKIWAVQSNPQGAVPYADLLDQKTDLISRALTLFTPSRELRWGGVSVSRTGVRVGDTALIDTRWSDDAFREIYRKLRETGAYGAEWGKPEHQVNPVTGIPSKLPLPDERARLIWAKTYADAAARHFAESRPFLSRLVYTQTEMPIQQVRKDIERFFRNNPGQTYNAGSSVTLIVNEITQDLTLQLPRVVTWFRAGLAALFLLFQMIPFGTIAVAAYRDIKVHL